MTRTANMHEVLFPDPGERTPTVLVVEDEVLIRIALSDYLQECGFKVLEAGTADEPVEIILHSSVVIDLVFSDAIMPGSMDGFALAKWIRANRASLPIILTSGDAGKADTAKDLCAREPFMAKPYGLDHLVKHFRTLIDSARTKTS